ncbi:MAG: response regulator [Acidobacteria bacterium]|nr:response regulator [Acidobacteriota bacterium]
MPTQALIVDQASGVRSLFARVLRSLNCVTHEAADGGEAVEVLQSTDINLAVIEAEAGLLSGIDLLRVLRESEPYANLPVVIVTTGADRDTVTEMVKLGAADCLTKPFDVELIKTRLQRLIKSISAAGALPTTPSSGPGTSGSALIVDKNPEFRHFVANCLMATYATTQMESGLDALRACQVRKFSVLVMGSDTGLLTPRLLARRLRRQSSLGDMRVVLVAPKGAAKELADPTAFDAIMHRTFVPEEFAQQFRQLFARSQSGEAGVIDIVRATVISATEQALGMMAGTDVALVSGDDGSPVGTLEASVVMSLQMERAAIRMALVSETGAATRIAARMVGVGDEDVSPEDGLSALGEVLNVIAGRVKSQISADGGTMAFTIPSLRTVTPDEEVAGAPVTLRFASADGALRLAVRLTVADAREGDAAPPVETPASTIA